MGRARSLNGRHIEKDDLRRIHDELATENAQQRRSMNGRAERLLEQLLKSLQRERRH